MSWNHNQKAQARKSHIPIGTSLIPVPSSVLRTTTSTSSNPPLSSLFPSLQKQQSQNVPQQPKQLSKQELIDELEKTEQSITLTLQEIDRNFAQAHKIVQQTIIPVIEKYGEQSRSLWSSAAFWKQFFEASANVALTGYEEPVTDEYENEYMEDPQEAEQNQAQQLEEEPTADSGNQPDEQADTSMGAQIPENKETLSIPSEENPQIPTHDDPFLSPDVHKVTKDDVDSSKKGNLVMSNMKKFKPFTETNPPITPTQKLFKNRNFDTEEGMSSIMSSPFNPQYDGDNNMGTPGAYKPSNPQSILRHQVMNQNWRVVATPKANPKYVFSAKSGGGTVPGLAESVIKLPGYTPSKTRISKLLKTNTTKTTTETDKNSANYRDLEKEKFIAENNQLLNEDFDSPFSDISPPKLNIAGLQDTMKKLNFTPKSTNTKTEMPYRSSAYDDDESPTSSKRTSLKSSHNLINKDEKNNATTTMTNFSKLPASTPKVGGSGSGFTFSTPLTKRIFTPLKTPRDDQNMSIIEDQSSFDNSLEFSKDLSPPITMQYNDIYKANNASSKEVSDKTGKRNSIGSLDDESMNFTALNEELTKKYKEEDLSESLLKFSDDDDS